MFEELRNASRPGNVGGFLPAVKQVANVAALPGIVWVSYGILALVVRNIASRKIVGTASEKTVFC